MCAGLYGHPVYVAWASNRKRDCNVAGLLILTCEWLNVMTSICEETLQHMISTVACCHSAKLCAHAALDFLSQQNGAVTRMWRLCWVQPSHKELVINLVRCKKEGCCCNLSGGVALMVWFTTNGMCVKNNTIIYVARASNRKRDCEHDLYCYLLPQCEPLRTCRSGFPIATK